jgi:hypothetical protein
MQATEVGGVVRGVVLVDDHVRDEAGATVQALEQIVAEQRILRHPVAERAAEGVHVVDALADVDALAEEVLIRLRDRARVDVDAGLARELAAEERAPGASRRYLHPGLKHRVAGPHPPVVDLRAVQGVRERAHEPRGGAGGQLRVAVQRQNEDDVSEAQGVPRMEDVGGVPFPEQETVQLLDLPALPLPSHPLPLRGIPARLAVEEMEGSALRAPVPRVEPPHAVHCMLEAGGLLSLLSLAWRTVRVGVIREQRKSQRGVAVRQVVDLQALGHAIDLLAIAEQRRHCDQRSPASRDAA